MPTSVLAYAMSQTPTFFPLDWKMMFYATTGGDGTDPLHPAGAAGVGFDATYDLLVNTLTQVQGVVANILCKYIAVFHVYSDKSSTLNAAQMGR
jgi:hypothetical protein